MENHFYHIRWSPLSVTILLRMGVYCVMGAMPMRKYAYWCQARSHFLPIKTLGHFTVNFLRTTVMLTVYCDLREGYKPAVAGPRSAVGNVSGYRCVSDCRFRGREFDPGPVPYFRGDWSWNDFYGHSPPFRWFIQEGLLSVSSESMCTNYWLTACSSQPRKKCD